MEEQSYTKCLNCHQQLSTDAAYCSNCGQKNTDGLISLKEFFHNFLDNVFNINSRIVQTLKWLCIPAKLTLEYFKGKHRTYYHPIRLYLVLSLIFFAILNLKDSSREDSVVEINLGDDELFEVTKKEAYKLDFLARIDTASQEILAQNNHPKAIEAIDSLKKLLPKPIKLDSMEINTIDFFQAGSGVIKIDRFDAYTLSGKELVEKYAVKGFWNQIFFKQGVHLHREPKDFSQQIVGSFPLMLLAMIPFLALFLKLLHIRRKRYYVEHLVMNFHHHSFMFFLLSFIFLLPSDGLFELTLPFGVIGTLIFLFLTMKRYYGQGFFKTFVKFILFNIFYLFIFIFILVCTFIISFLLF